MPKSVLNAIGWLLPLAVALIATPLLMRALGAPIYGLWALCLVMVTVLPQIDFGLGTTAVREIAATGSRPDAQLQISSELFTFSAVLATLVCALIALGAAHIAHLLNFDEATDRSQGTLIVALVGPWAAVAIVNAAMTALPRAFERFDILTLVTSTTSMVQWAGATLLAFAGIPVEGLVCFGIAVQLLATFALLRAHHRLIGSLPALRRLSLLRSKSGFAAASFVSSLASIATYHADKLLVAALLGPAAAGLYAAISNVASKLLGLVAALGSVLFPRVSSLFTQGHGAGIAMLYDTYRRAVMAIALVLGAIAIVLAERFLDLWLKGNSSPELVFTFRLLVIAYIANSTSVVASNVLNGRGNAKRGAWFSVAGGVVTIACAWLLLPSIGLAGAGIAAVIGMSQSVVFDLWLRQELAKDARPWRMPAAPWIGWLISACGAAAAAWACIAFFPGWGGLFTSGVVAVAAAASVWFAGRFASIDEKRVVRHFASSLIRMTGIR